MDSYYLNRMLNLATDPRMPYNVVVKSLRTRKLRRIMDLTNQRKERHLLVALTFDVEREYGSFSKGNGATVPRFLRSVQDIADEGAIFIEGSLVRENSWILRSLEKRGIEIGLHGYRHELWGPPQWYLRDKPLTLERRNLLLDAAIEVFRSSGLRRPVAFRAPNLVADASTMFLLLQKGFQVDSSLAAHRGITPIPLFFGGSDGLVRIPVTVEPMPSLSRKVSLPYYRYRVCNLKTLREMKERDILEYVWRIMIVQKALGFEPHLVILSHSWEFFVPLIDDNEYRYCSPLNFEFIRYLLDVLLHNFSVKRVSMSGLARYFREKTFSARKEENEGWCSTNE